MRAFLELEPKSGNTAPASAHERRLNVNQIPIMRAAGLTALFIACIAHNAIFFDSIEWTALGTFGVVLAAYAATSWFVLRKFYGRTRKIDLAFVFLSFDAVAFLVAVALTGLDKSWLFIVLLMRMADQSTTTTRRVLWFTTLTAGGYVTLLFLAPLITGREIGWSGEALKIGCLVFAGVYLSAGASYTVRLRKHATALASRARVLIEEVGVQSREVEAARSNLEDMETVRSRFLERVSHQLRTPMNGIVGMTAMLSDTELDEEQKRYLETMRSASDELISVVEGIIDFSRIQSGELELTESELDIRSLFEDVLEVQAWRAHEKGLELTGTIGREVPTLVLGDPGRLRQILMTLTDNAIDYTESGSVSCRMHAHSVAGKSVSIKFEVEDTGVGMPEATAKTVFQPFRLARTRAGSSGLSLPTASMIVDLMGGSISVTSEPNSGSVFIVSVPLQIAKSSTDAAFRPDERLSGHRVLCVDPHPHSRASLRLMLEVFGVTVGAVSDPDVALRTLCEEADASRGYSAVLIDSSFEDGTPSSLGQRIKATRGLSTTPLILLRTIRTHDELQEPRPAEFVSRVSKPVRSGRMHLALCWALGLKDGSEEQRVDPSGQILLAEDNVVNQRVAKMMLEKEGFSVDVADDGQQALKLAGENDYELILMDCEMPHLDGFAATEAIRREERGQKRTPIIAMTALAMSGDRERCMASGMDDYLSKPIDRDALVTIIERWTAAASVV